MPLHPLYTILLLTHSSPLRYDMVFNSIIKYNLAGFCGRSKPLPYAFNKYVIPEKFRSLSEKFRSLSEGAVERSETEGVKKIKSNYKELPQSFFCEKMTAPSKIEQVRKKWTIEKRALLM